MSTGNVMPHPLCLPENLRSPSSFQVFLKELPLAGIISRRRRAVRRQLEARESIAATGAFGTADLETQRIAEEVSNVIRRHFRWPSGNFLPQDPCELLFCGSASGMQDVSAIMEIAERFGLGNDELNDYRSLSFGQLVERLKRAQERQR
jgi:hypothetical protein